jgi:hypothetical protein
MITSDLQAYSTAAASLRVSGLTEDEVKILQIAAEETAASEVSLSFTGTLLLILVMFTFTIVMCLVSVLVVTTKLKKSPELLDILHAAFKDKFIEFLTCIAVVVIGFVC